MLMAAIQKQYTVVSFIQSKLKIQFKFPIWNSLISVFQKKKNSITHLMIIMAMFDCFLVSFAREKSHGKNQRQTKMRSYGKNIFLQSRCIVLTWWLSALLKLEGPFAFLPVRKLSLHDKLYEASSLL